MIPLGAFPIQDLRFEGDGVRLERLTQGVHRLVLARPKKRNAFDAPMIQALTHSLESLDSLASGAFRLLVLDAEGDTFCAGADLGYMREQATASEAENREDARRLGALFYRLASLPVPVLAAVRGAAIGGGLGIVACADRVLAEASACFATSEVRLGLVPAVISPYILRRLGLSAAAPLMLSGARIDACEAHCIGLVHQVIPDSQAWEPTLARAVREFLAGGPEAVRRTKGLLLEQVPLPDPDLRELTAGTIAQVRVSAEAQAGLGAFFDRAAAPWMPEEP